MEDYDFSRLLTGKPRARPKEKGIKIYATVKGKEASRERQKEKDKPTESPKDK